MSLFQKYKVSYSEVKHCLRFSIKRSHVGITSVAKRGSIKIAAQLPSQYRCHETNVRTRFILNF